jgi:hypothetical protein
MAGANGSTLELDQRLDEAVTGYLEAADWPPFKAESPLETLLAVLDEEPAAPRALSPRIDRDLETICLKCLRKESRRRYSSAEALADDLDRFLAGEPIQARPTTAVARAWKWARRRPAAALLVVASTVAALGLVGGYAGYARQRARLEEQQLEQELSERRRIDDRRKEAQAHVARAQEAAGRGGWPEAQSEAAAALGILQSEAALDDDRAPAERLPSEAARRLGEQAAREHAARTYREFRSRPDKA